MTLPKSEKILIIASLAVKLGFFALLVLLMGQGAVFSNSDSNLLFAQNIFYHHIFSQSTTTPYLPSEFVTPGYPFFLALTGVATGWVGFTIVLQIILMTIAAVLLYRMLVIIFGETLAFSGALIFAIEPWNAFVASFPLTEAIFLLLLIAACYSFTRALDGRRTVTFFLSGLLLGGAILVRPIAEFLPIIPLACLLLFYRAFSLSLKQALLAGSMLVVGCLLIVAPWVARNYEQFHMLSLDTKGPYTVYFYDVLSLVAYRDHISNQQANDKLFAIAERDNPGLVLQSDLVYPQYAHYLDAQSLKEIEQTPLLYAKLYAGSIATFFFSDGYRLILTYTEAISPNLPNITFLVLSGKFGALFSYLRGDPLIAFVFVLGSLFWACSTLLAFAAIPIAFFWEKDARARAWIYGFGALMCYFALLTGLVAMARYRVPVTPFLFPLALYSAQFIPVRRSKFRYYYKDIAKLIAYIIPKGSSVLEIAQGAGAEAIESVRTPKTASSYDYVLMLDAIGSMRDIGEAFVKARKHLSQDGRLVVTFHNFLWEPIFVAAEKLRLKKVSRTQNWISSSDVKNLLFLAGFGVVRSGKRMLCPVYVPLLSAFLNALGRLPLISKLCITNYIVARPIPDRRDYSVSIIVPARNEKGNIRPIIERIPNFGLSQELIFIEGHSKDGTWEEIERAAAQYQGPMRIKTAKQAGMGKGDAVRLGFEMASNEVLMILDADMTVVPEDLPKFYEALAQGKADFINGSRLIYPMEDEAMRFLNTIANKCFAILFTWLLDQQIKDTLCGTKVLRKVHYEQIARNRIYFGDFDPFGDYDLLFGAVKQNLKIVDLPIRYRQRLYGTTQIHRWAHGWLLLKMCVFAARKIKFN